MSYNNEYWQLNCVFPIENKSLTIKLPLDIEFKLKTLASKENSSPEKLAANIIENYIRSNCKNKTLDKLFK